MRDFGALIISNLGKSLKVGRALSIFLCVIQMAIGLKLCKMTGRWSPPHRNSLPLDVVQQTWYAAPPRIAGTDSRPVRRSLIVTQLSALLVHGPRARACAFGPFPWTVRTLADSYGW